MKTVDRPMTEAIGYGTSARRWLGTAVFGSITILSGCTNDGTVEVATLTSTSVHVVPDTLTIVRPLAAGWLAQVAGGRQIVRLDSAFQITQTIAVRGQGPAEFRQAAWMGPSNDTVLIWDRGGHKLLIAAGGSPVSEVDAQALPNSASILGRTGDDRYLVSTGAAPGNTSERVLQFWSAKDGLIDSITTLVQAPVVWLRVQRGNTGVAFMLPRQFTASDRAVLLANGDVAVMRGSSSEVTCCLSSGFATSTLVGIVGNAEVGEADRARVIRGLPMIKDVTGDSLWPATRDALRNEDPFAGETGDIWLRLSTSADSASTTFAVVSAGRVEPRYFTIAGADWSVLAADSVRLIAKSLNEDGAEQVGYFSLRVD